MSTDTKILDTKKRKQLMSAKTLQALEEGKFISESFGRGQGSLVARGSANGALWYFRWGQAGRMVPIGSFPRLSLKEAREIARKHQSEYIEYQKGRTSKRPGEEAQQQREENLHAEQARGLTLTDLMRVYVDWLTAKRSKNTADDVRRTVERAAKRAPRLFSTAAREVAKGEFAKLLHQYEDENKLREAQKLRAFVSAAYRRSLASDGDSSNAFGRFHVETDPAGATAQVELHNGNIASEDDKPVLPPSALPYYWQRLNQLPESVDKRFALLHLLLAGQRQQQLLRVRIADVDLHAKTLRTINTKGRKSRPKVHTLPLSPLAFSLVQDCIKHKPHKEYLFLNGEDAVHENAANRRFIRLVQSVAEEMEKAGETPVSFPPSSIRRTAHSRLIEAGVLPHIVDQLHSHVFSGAQRHYAFANMRRFYEEALSTWEQLIGVSQQDAPAAGT